MRSGTIAALCGILLVTQLAALPAVQAAYCLPLLLLLGIKYSRLRVVCFFLGGVGWALAHGHARLEDRLPASWQGQERVVTGTVISVPDRNRDRIRFDLAIDDVLGSAGEGPADWRGRTRLTWYAAEVEIASGERWQLRVRLRQPRGFKNPGGFDYEGWLFQHAIGATGYVRADRGNLRIEPAPAHSLDGLRERLSRRIGATLADHPHAGVVRALAIGLYQGISPRQWEVMRATGTTHLMAISGSHIALIAALAFFSARWLWVLPRPAPLLLPAQQVGAAAAMLGAFAYSALAGFAIPTQRAFVMVAVVTLASLMGRKTSTSHVLATSLLVVLIVDPFAVLSVGFWLSFVAVAVILWVMSIRLCAPERQRAAPWLDWLAVQLALFVGLLPITFLCFGEQASIAPVANLVAVPWVSLVVVPCVLLGTALLSLSPDAAQLLLTLAAESLELLWPFLELLADLRIPLRAPRDLGLWVTGAAMAGAFLLLAPRPTPGKWVACLWIAPVLMAEPVPVASGSLELTVLDVGQGLAAVARTANHVLVYDTGPRFTPDFDAGRAVVVPFLRSRGIERVDVVLVSHGDNDHIGGLHGLLVGLEVGELVTNVEVPELARGCQAGMTWIWDQVEFETLYPPPERRGNANESSCVLKVSTAGGSVLLTGDIERGAEAWLVAERGDALKSDILVVPHHGSASSSSAAFLDAVAPSFALFPAGHANRFGFPKPSVLARYLERDIRTYLTGRDGAITFDLVPGRPIVAPALYREEARRFWDDGERLPRDG